MGMAASQARFLGLTARKSNVEYQGQQVNQQRTALSNESSNIYSEMMDLEVPTPPSSSDYKKTAYVLEDSSDSYAKEDYTINGVTKTYAAEGQYLVTLTSKAEQTASTSASYKIQSSTSSQYGEVVYQQKQNEEGALLYQQVNENNELLYHSVDEEGNKLYYTDETQTQTQTEASDYPVSTNVKNDYPLETTENTGNPIYATDENGNKIVSNNTTGTKHSFILTSSTSTRNLTYDANDCNAYTGNNGSLAVVENQIYQIDSSKASDLDGYNECVKENSDIAYFYKSGDTNYFLSENELQAMLNGDSSTTINPDYKYTYSKPVSTQVVGYLESSTESNRYSTLTIESNDTYPENLSGKTFSLSYTQVADEDAYNDAYNDYEYQKAMYDKTINDLDAKTEIIQKQDQNLELKLKQLDTEENAIKTEMDAVKSVLKDNVEKTFNTFG